MEEININKFVYADNAATTKITDEVFNAMVPFLKENYGNPSSIYSIGRAGKNAIEDAREKIAKALNCTAREIYFTSCGTEADNWAIKGAAAIGAKKGKKKIITSIFEHHAVLHTCKTLENQGFEVVYIPVDEKGFVKLDILEKEMNENTALVTIMFANNEIGTIQPIEKIGQMCKEKGVLFHTDAVQAVGHEKIDVQAMNIDMLSLSGHKIHAPKGVGALYIKKGVIIPNLLEGGAQEKNKRAGTENVAGIVALGKAVDEAVLHLQENKEKTKILTDKLKTELLKIERTRLNGDDEKRLAGNVNISFEGVEGESLLLMLDFKGICASSGSACTSGSLDPSHVLLAIGLKHEVAHGSLRLSLNELNTQNDVDYILSVVPEIIARLRSMSPLWERIKSKEN
ncbi:MAG: cysteine desulfurase NifS [Clostridia bacterium]